MSEEATKAKADAENKAASAREKLSGKNRPKRKFVVEFPSFGESDPIKVELRAPSIALRREIDEEAAARGKDGQAFVIDVMFQTMIRCAYIPGTDERIWNNDSMDDFLALLVGDPLLDAIEDAFKQLNEVPTKEDVKKN